MPLGMILIMEPLSGERERNLNHQSTNGMREKVGPRLKQKGNMRR